MNLWAKYLKENTKDLQITVSISKEPHIIYKLINILITVQNAERSLNEKKKHRNHEYQTPKTERKKTKTLTYAPKVKNNRALPEEKTTFRKLSISFSKPLTVMNKAHGY